LKSLTSELFCTIEHVTLTRVGIPESQGNPVAECMALTSVAASDEQMSLFRVTT